MLITTIMGIITEILFVIFFDIVNYKILLLPALYYAIGYLAIGYGLGGNLVSKRIG